jgi:hypothetical protein
MRETPSARGDTGLLQRVAAVTRRIGDCIAGFKSSMVSLLRLNGDDTPEGVGALSFDPETEAMWMEEQQGGILSSLTARIKKLFQSLLAKKQLVSGDFEEWPDSFDAAHLD